MSQKRNKGLVATGITILVILLAGIFLMPLVYGLSMSLKSPEQIFDTELEVLPRAAAILHYQDQELEIYQVPLDNGQTRQLAALEKTRSKVLFIDPTEPEAAPIEWVGNWRKLERVKELAPQWSNYLEAWNTIDFVRLLLNTALYAGLNTLGVVLSSSIVAYGFARFRFPGKNFFFMLIMATIILPSAVMLIPTYAFFNSIGWVGSWLPLIVPAFFANAYNVFLMRQFLLNIPKEMDESARMDGAGPLRTLFSIILPQAGPALTAMALFNFFYCWNDYFSPLVYLSGKPELYPISVGLSAFSTQYTSASHLVQAASILASIFPIVVFFIGQRAFMQGVVVTGVEK